MHWLIYPAAGLIAVAAAVGLFLREMFAPPSKNTTWQAHVAKSHGPLEQIAPRLWVVRAAGRPERSMVIYMLNSGGLLLHSVIALQETEQKQLEALGDVQYIVVPNPFHRLDAHVYHLRYPRAKVICPAAARRAIQKAVDVDATAEEALAGLREIQVLNPDGFSRPIEHLYLLDVSASKNEDKKALVCCDAIFNLGPDAGLIPKLIGSVGDGSNPIVSRIFKSGLKDQKAYGQWLIKIAEDYDLAVMVPAHGTPVTADCRNKMIQCGKALL